MTLPEIFNTYAADADYVDHKTARSTLPLREFLARFLSHYPWWVKALYGVRAGLVRVLGMRQRMEGYQLTLAPDQIPFEPGRQATIFKVLQAAEDRSWIVTASDKHLTATLGVVREPAGDQAAFHIVTLVHHHHWTGPVYFNLIRPFHHLVVGSMIRAGLRYGQDRPRGASLGLWLVAIALLHQAVGLYFYSDALGAIWRDGVLNAIGLNWDRDAAFWFFMFGFMLAVFGLFTHWLVNDVGRVPSFWGLSLLAIGLLGVALMPASGFWLVLPVAVILIRLAPEVGSAPDPGLSNHVRR